MARTTDIPKAERVAKILIHLIRNRTRQYTVADIVRWLNEEEQVSRRNVERDLKLLAQIPGGPVTTGRRGRNLTYFIAPDMRDKFSLPVERNSLLTLFLLKRLQPLLVSKGADDDKLGEALAQLSLEAHYDLFEDLDERLGRDAVVVGGQPATGLSGNMLSDTITALVERRVLEIEYLRDPHEGPERKTIRPVKLMLSNGELYLVCLRDAKGGKVSYYIKLCRITKAVLTDRHFDVPAEALAKIEARLAKSFGILDDEDAPPEKVSVRFPAWLEQVLNEKRFHRSQQVSRESKNTVLVTFEAPVGFELVKWVLGWAGEAEVVKPESLRKMVREAAAEIARTHKSC